MKTLFLLLCLITLFFYTQPTHAYENPRTIYICVEGVKFSNFNYKLGYYTKDRGGLQYIDITKVYTNLTANCISCRISAKLFNENGDSYSGVVIKSSTEKKRFRVTEPNIWKL